MARARTELVHCDVCGEDYAATYRRCPFCNGKGQQQQDDYDDEDLFEEEEDAQRPGGKRLAGSASRFGHLDPAKIAIYVLAALIILAVVCVLISLLFSGSKDKDASDKASATASASAIVSNAVETAGGEEYDPLSQENAPPVGEDPVSNANQGSNTQTSTTAKLTYAGVSKSDITITPKDPPIKLEVKGGTASSWSSQKPGVATVSENGTITPVSNGTTVVDCTLSDGAVLHCTIRISGFSGQSSSNQDPSGQGSSGQTSSSAKLTYAGAAKEDITVAVNEAIPLKVQGGTASSWSSRNTGIATVSAGGTVTGVSKGTTTVDCTLSDGTVLHCIVRVSGS